MRIDLFYPGWWQFSVLFRGKHCWLGIKWRIPGTTRFTEFPEVYISKFIKDPSCQYMSKVLLIYYQNAGKFGNNCSWFRLPFEEPGKYRCENVLRNSLIRVKTKTIIIRAGIKKNTKRSILFRRIMLVIHEARLLQLLYAKVEFYEYINGAIVSECNEYILQVN